MENTNTASNSVQTFEYTIRTSGNTAKKYYVARFPEKQPVEWSKWNQPVKLTKNEVIEEEIPAMPTLPTVGSRSHKRRQLERYYQKKKESTHRKELTWTFEDSKKEQVLDGTLEAGQNSSYVLFSMEGNEFRVYPVGQWFNFKHRSQYTTLTLEQAEEQLHSRKNKMDRWMMRKFMKEDDVKLDAKEEPKGADTEDMGPRQEEKVRRPKTEPEEEEQPDLEDIEDTDFQSKFDDDDEDEVLEELEELDAEEDEKALTASGKELKTLLKNASKQEEFSVSSEEEEDEEEENEADKKIVQEEPDLVPMKVEPTLESTLAAVSKKRPATEDLNDKDGKKVKAKTEEVTPVDEEEVRKALLVLGKAKTKTFVNKFKAQLVDEEQKARFAKIVKKLARIVDEHGERYFVLKDEYRGGLKGPK